MESNYQTIDKEIARIEKDCERLERKAKKNGLLSLGYDVLALVRRINTVYFKQLSVYRRELLKASELFSSYAEQRDLHAANVVSSFSDEKSHESLSESEIGEITDDSEKVVHNLEKELAGFVVPIAEKLKRKAKIVDIMYRYRNLFLK